MTITIKAGAELIAHNLVFDWQRGGPPFYDKLERLIAQALREARIAAFEEARTIILDGAFLNRPGARIAELIAREKK